MTDLDWAVANKTRYAGMGMALLFVTFVGAATLWLLPLSFFSIRELARLNEHRAKFINVPGFIARYATALLGLAMLMLAALRVSVMLNVAPDRAPWPNILGISFVLVFGGSILCHAILMLRYGSPFDEPGHPPKA